MEERLLLFLVPAVHRLHESLNESGLPVRSLRTRSFRNRNQQKRKIAIGTRTIVKFIVMYRILLETTTEARSPL